MTERRWRPVGGANGRERAVTELRVLDPAGADPAYWARFHDGVMRRTAAELRRRRSRLGESVEDVLTAWARTLVPTALLAAAAAALLLLRAPAVPAPLPLGVEELLVRGLDDGTFPSAITSEVDATVAFASDRF